MIGFRALVETLKPVGAIVGVSDSVWVGVFDGVCERETEKTIEYNKGWIRTASADISPFLYRRSAPTPR